jgi:phage virion morphogenesis protein
MMIIEIDDQKILAALNDLARRASPAGLRGVLKAIGEDLEESTKQRFNTGKAPDGSRWLPNARSTYEALVSGTRGAVGKKGTLTKKGSGTVMGKKPLVRDGQLRDSIRYQRLPGGNGVEVGSNRRYAAMQQFGGKKSEFPNLWGDIPARPFLGLSASDKENILDVISRHLKAP